MKRVSAIVAIVAALAAGSAFQASADVVQTDIYTVPFVSPFDLAAYEPGNVTPLLLSPFDTREVRCGTHQGAYGCVQYDNQGNFHLMTILFGAPYREFWYVSPF